jgi:hypothetical protein
MNREPRIVDRREAYRERLRAAGLHRLPDFGARVRRGVRIQREIRQRNTHAR